MIAVWESDISAKDKFLISRLKWLTDTAFFKLLGMVSGESLRRRANARNVSSESLYGCLFTLSTQLIKPDFFL